MSRMFVLYFTPHDARNILTLAIERHACANHFWRPYWDRLRQSIERQIETAQARRAGAAPPIDANILDLHLQLTEEDALLLMGRIVAARDATGEPDPDWTRVAARYSEAMSDALDALKPRNLQTKFKPAYGKMPSTVQNDD